MIQNDDEVRIVWDEINELVRARDRAALNKDATEFGRSISALGFQRKIDHLKDEIAEYEATKSARTPALPAKVI